jgi:hypothetical protein
MNETMLPPNIGQASRQLHAARIFKQCAFILALLTVTTAVSWARGLAVSAELEPTEIAFGDSSQLTVNITGQQADAPNLPSVSGLSFDHVGESSQYQIINGAMSASVAHTYLVTPSRPGTFTIPKLKVGSGAGAAESNPLVLKVLKRSGAPAPTANGNQATRSLPAPSVTGGDEDLPSVGRNEIGFLRVVVPKKEFYVGEMVPVELKAYFRAGVELRVDGLPQLNSDAFTMNQLGPKPARSQELIDGELFTVFTWPTAITAVKAGDYQMTVEIPTTVTVRQRAARPRSLFGDSFFDDAFGDSLFDRFFGSATQKQVKLSSAATSVKILSLPTEKRPESFAGAVGQFDINVSATPTRAGEGDPITLKLKITGRGNFDRVTAPILDTGDAWKAYKPSEKFEASDSAGDEGAKTFEMALVPKQTGKLDIPALEFSYFDPERREYVARTTSAMSVEVAPAVAGSAPAAKAIAPDVATKQDERVAAGDGSVPNKLDAGSFTRTLRPWVLSPWFLAVNAFEITGAAMALGLIRHHRRLSNDPKRTRATAADRAVRAQLDAMNIAARQNDACAFFLAARRAIQHRLGARWGLPAHAITLADVDARMNGEADGFRSIFEFADEMIYTGRTFVADLPSWMETVDTELKRLEAV